MLSKLKRVPRASLSPQHSAFSTNSVSGALKPKESRSLEAELPPVALDEVAELAAGDMELQPVAALKLEGDIVKGIRCSEAYPPPPEMAIFNSILPLFCHHSIHCQPGRAINPVPLPKVPDEDQREREQE